MNDKLEEVARAICLAGEVPDDVRKDCEVLCSMCLDESRAAIEAMRDPSDEMIARADMELNSEFGFVTRDVLRAAIDAALEGKS